MGTETSSTPQSANAGNALTNLFLSNQATPRVSTPTIAAPQSPITPDLFNVQQPPAAPQPAAPSIPQYLYRSAFGGTGGGDADHTSHPYAPMQVYANPAYVPDRSAFDPFGFFGGMGARSSQSQAPFRVPQTALIAQNINKKYGGS